jgi:F0F1-type ATP synthase assembly protein I
MTPSQGDEPRETPPPPNPWRYAGLGVELASAIIGLTLLGWWADYHFGWAPRGVLVGAGIGIVGGFYNFLRQAIAMARQEERRRQSAHHDQPRDDHVRPAH